MTLNEQLQDAVDAAFEIDKAIADLNGQLGELIKEMQGEKRPHEAGFLIGIQSNLNTAFYRKLGGSLQDMQK